jgi:hypothetical protein
MMDANESLATDLMMATVGEETRVSSSSLAIEAKGNEV